VSCGQERVVKRIQFMSVYGGLLVVMAVLAAMAARGDLKAAGDCSSAYALAAMSRAQAEACFSRQFD
jgi:hypothetical protein